MSTTANTAITTEVGHIKGISLVLLAGVFWSIAGIIVRLIESASEWQILFYRSGSLAVMLVIVLAVQNRRALLTTFRAAGTAGVVGGLCLAVGFTCWIFALTHTTVANALFLLATAPFIVAILARLVLGERVKRATWVAMLVATVGITVMVGEGIAVGTLFGNVMGLGAALGFSGFTVALRYGKTVNMLPTVCFAGVFATLSSGIMIVATGHGITIPANDLWLCTMLGVVQIGCGLILYTIGSRYVPAAELALLSLTEVVLGPIWVWIGVGEVPSVLTLLGGVIVLVAVGARALLEVRRRPPIGVV
ncbi:MAG: DMT family transporter [Acidiferrobacterales bacterium]